MIEEVLKQIGLTQNEIKVYLALLNLGESKTGQILEKSGLNSGKIYEILDSLQKKGLVSFVEKNKIKYFSSANPKRVFDYLNEKKNEILKQEKEYKNILPELLSKISKISKKTKIEIFTGLKGMKTAYAKELEYGKNETLYVFGIPSSKKMIGKIENFFFYTHYPNRLRRGFKIKKLLSLESRDKELNQEKNAELRFFPYQSIVSINTIGNLSTIGLLIDEPIIISIESEEVAKSFKEQFELLWKLAKK